MRVVRVDVDVIEEVLTHEVVIALGIVVRKAAILVQVVGANLGKVDVALRVPSSELLVGTDRGGAGGKAQHTVGLEDNLRRDDISGLAAHILVVFSFNLIFELLFQLYHNFRVKVFQSDLSQQKKDLDRLNLVLNYISENYKRPISLDEIAGVAYLQTGYFCRFFKKKMGITFLEYQNEYRLSFIYKDLINTKAPVHVILERHGFTNYKLFRRMFQEHFGCTPTKVRENMKK